VVNGALRLHAGMAPQRNDACQPHVTTAGVERLDQPGVNEADGVRECETAVERGTSW
jgi:hypothetical protein